MDFSSKTKRCKFCLAKKFEHSRENVFSVKVFFLRKCGRGIPYSDFVF
jgi:hypothetical protein